MSASLPNLLLLLACAAYAAVHSIRAGAASQLRPALIAAALIILALLTAAGFLAPAHKAYPTADIERAAHTVAAAADREASTADCLIAYDGSSIHTHAVHTEVLRAKLQASGHKPCVLAMALLGGDHFERQWIAQRARELMQPSTRAKLDTLPAVWVKELHWSYDSDPHRFLGQSADTDRLRAACDPALAGSGLHALHGNWKQHCRAEKLSTLASYQAFPTAQVSALIRNTAGNLFHVGHLQRLLAPPVQPLIYEHGQRELSPMQTTWRWWDERFPADAEAKGSAKLRPRKWLADLLARAPLGWPQRKGFQLVLAAPPAMNTFVNNYAVEAAKSELYRPYTLFLGARDPALRLQLDRKECWRDLIHLEQPGAELYTAWLADRIAPLLPAR